MDPTTPITTRLDAATLETLDRLAERFDRGRTLLIVVLLMSGTSAVLAVLDRTGQLEIWHLAVASFIVNTLAPSVDWLEPFRLLSPFYYYSGGAPILNGLDPVHALVLVSASAVALVFALWAFERRDLAA